jgi:hypothetical protein
MTKSVQPYCRLAISAMQMMQKMSWVQRVAGDANEWESTVCDTVVMGFRSPTVLCRLSGDVYLNSARRFSQLEEEV